MCVCGGGKSGTLTRSNKFDMGESAGDLKSAQICLVRRQ